MADKRKDIKLRMRGFEGGTLPHKCKQTTFNLPGLLWLYIALVEAFKRIACVHIVQPDIQMKDRTQIVRDSQGDVIEMKLGAVHCQNCIDWELR